MKKKIKNLLVLSGFLLLTQHIQAQANTALWDKLSLEVQYGMNTALSPKDNSTKSDYNGFKFFQSGINYQIDEIWGIRGTYAMSNFKHKNLDGFGVSYKKLVLEGTYNILAAVNKAPQLFDITAHAGLGLGMGASETLKDDDMVGVFQVGLMPKYTFNSRISAFLDATYVNQFSQDYGFNGLAIKQGSGSYLNVGLGVQVRLGK